MVGSRCGRQRALEYIFLVYQIHGTAGESANTRLLATLNNSVYVVCRAFGLDMVEETQRADEDRCVFHWIYRHLWCLVFFGIQLIAIQKPTLPLFITELDARMEKRHWNQLAPDAMVFDPDPLRVVTVFGRALMP